MDITGDGAQEDEEAYYTPKEGNDNLSQQLLTNLVHFCPKTFSQSDKMVPIFHYFVANFSHSALTPKSRTPKQRGRPAALDITGDGGQEDEEAYYTPKEGNESGGRTLNPDP